MSSTSTSELSSREQWVKRLFVAIVVLFPIQYWFAVSVTEPYPALKLPAFTGARVDAEGKFLINYGEVEFDFAEGSRARITMRQLFAGLPSSQFNIMATYALRPKPRPRPDKPWPDSDWKRHLPWHLFPGYQLKKERKLYWDGVEPATLEWLQKRAREMFPDRTATKATVNWYNEEFQWQDGQVTRNRVLTDVLEVEL